MKKNLKKVLASLLSFVMLFTMLAPSYAFAVDTDIARTTENFVRDGVEYERTSVTDPETNVTTNTLSTEDYTIITTRYATEVVVRVLRSDKESTFTVPLTDPDEVQDEARITPYAKYSYFSGYFDGDGYEYYSSLDSWRLYYDGKSVTTGDNIVSGNTYDHCISFEKNIEDADDYANAAARAIPGINLASTVIEVLEIFAEEGTGAAAMRIVEDIIWEAISAADPTGLLKYDKIIDNLLECWGCHETYKSDYIYVRNHRN